MCLSAPILFYFLGEIFRTFSRRSINRGSIETNDRETNSPCRVIRDLPSSHKTLLTVAIEPLATFFLLPSLHPWLHPLDMSSSFSEQKTPSTGRRTPGDVLIEIAHCLESQQDMLNLCLTVRGHFCCMPFDKMWNVF